MATVLIYLTAPEEGGETVFPLEGEHGLDRLPTINYTSCNQGLKVCLMYDNDLLGQLSSCPLLFTRENALPVSSAVYLCSVSVLLLVHEAYLGLACTSIMAKH